jgi:type IV secretion system protein VirB2
MIKKGSQWFATSSLAVALSLLLTDHSFAGQAGGLPYEAWLTKVQQSMTGPVAYGVSLIGIIGAGGVLIFGGELNAFLRTIVFIVLVMALLIGANALMTGLFGGNAAVAALGF